MDKKPLKFKNGQFKIMLLGDPHESFNTTENNGAAKLEDCLNLFNTAADELNPDMVVFLGDNASGNNEDEMRECIKRIMEPFAKRNIPVGVIFGNHDHDRTDLVDLETQLRLFNEFDNCYLYNADDSLTGYGNCNFTIQASDSDKEIYNLWFIDSNNLCEDKTVSKYDWVRPEQIEWYKKTAKELAEKNGGKVLPAILFQHIPVPEEYRLLREAKPWEYFDAIRGHESYSDKMYVLKNEVEGYLGEGPACPDVNSGEFEAWKEIGDIKGAFFGHDHMNDFAGYVDGILLAQSKLAGFRPYTDGCHTGVRLITLREENLEDIDTRMYYFKKDFGLKSQSLSFYESHITDRQDLKLKTALKVTGAVAGIVASSVIIHKLLKK